MSKDRETKKERIDRIYYEERNIEWEDLEEFTKNLRSSSDMIENVSLCGIKNVGGIGDHKVYTPELEKKKDGRINIPIPVMFFNNTEDIRNLNTGKYKIFFLVMKYKDSLFQPNLNED